MYVRRIYIDRVLAHCMMASGWSTSATKALVSVWSEENVQGQFDGVSRNRSIFERIASVLCAKGYDKTWQQCRTKIKNLTQKYRKVKDKNRVSGEGRHICPFYDELDAVLGTRAATSPPAVLESSSVGLNDSDAAGTGEEVENTSPEIDDSQVGEDDDSVRDDTGADIDGGIGGSGSGGNVSGGSENVSVDGGGTTISGGIVSSGSENVNSDGGGTTRKRGQKRKKKDCDASDELSTILTKFIEITEESETKRRRIEAEIEERRREQERKHEERMLSLMAGYMQRVVGFPQPPVQAARAFSNARTFPPGVDFSHSTQNSLPSDNSFASPGQYRGASPPYYENDNFN